MTAQRFINGMHARFREAASSRGTVLYIHGLGDSGLCLEGIMAHPLLNGFSHLAADLPGYGKSPWPDKPLSIPMYADLLAQWISSPEVPLDVAQVILVGHSMGGVIGTVLCERHPEKVRAFINVEGNISLQDCTFSCTIAAHSLDDFIERGFTSFRDDIYKKGLSERALRIYHAGLLMCDPRSIHFNSRELVELSESEELAARLGSLKIPVFYVWGSPGGTAEHSRSLLRTQGVPLVPVHESGHWPFIDRPDAFAERIIEIAGALRA